MRLQSLHLLEGVGHADYSPPGDPHQLMADFYVLQLLSAGPTGVSHRGEELSFEVARARSIIIPRLREHLLGVAGSAIISELKHLFDATMPVATIGRRYAADLVRYARAAGLSSSMLRYFRADETFGGSWRRNFSIADKLQCATAGLTLFRNNDVYRWETSYGGESWALICKTWLELYNARSLADAEVYCDKMYSVEHNTGSVLDKDARYDDNRLRWLLDLKFETSEPEPLMRFASPYVKRLGARVLRSGRGRSWGDQVEVDDLFLDALQQKLRRIGLNVASSQYVSRDYSKEYVIVRDGLALGRIKMSLDGDRVQANRDGLSRIFDVRPKSIDDIVKFYSG